MSETEHRSDEISAIKDAHARLQDEARPEAVAKQHGRGKLTARERLDLLLDPEGRVEYGALVTPDEAAVANVSADGAQKAAALPFEGPVCFTGFINGRPVGVMADDFTVLGGSMYAIGAKKMRWMADLCQRRGFPFIALLDGAGHRIHSMDSRMFASGGEHGPFRLMANLSGYAPMVAAVMGPAFAGPALIAGMADFVPMVKGNSGVAMAGAKFAEVATGEKLTMEELGGSAVQTRSGAADMECADDAECIARIKEYLSFFPSNADEPPPIVQPSEPANQLVPELRDILPESRRRAYDMRDVIRLIVDDGHTFELRANYAKHLLTMLARIDGRSVGVIANQPMQMAGTLDAAACHKAAKFVSLCDAFGFPLVSLIDTPGMLVGSKPESENIVKASGRLLMVLGHATVPLVSVVVRKAYGGGYVAMGGGRSYDAEASLIWPQGEVSAMGAEGSVDIAFHRDYADAPDPAARRQELIDEFYASMTPVRAVSGFGLDDAIDPAETRMRIASVLRTNQGRKRPPGPAKRHWIDPF